MIGGGVKLGLAYLHGLDESPYECEPMTRRYFSRLFVPFFYIYGRVLQLGR